MKRRRFFQAVTAVSAAPALVAQDVSAQQGLAETARGTAPSPKIEITSPDAAGEPVPLLHRAAVRGAPSFG